jgi:hydroxymethylglutaryl-CoA synthase
MAEKTGIVRFGAFVPQLRLKRSAIAAANVWANPGLKGQAKGERAICAWDEDVVTMSVEAARDALADHPREKISACLLASTSAPFADRLNAGLVAGALNLPSSITSLDVSGSLRAGTSALIAALALSAANDDPVLLVAGEHRNAKPGSVTEMQQGDAAAAFLVGRNPVAALVASHTITVDFVDHFRATGQKHDYGWEERWIRDEGYMKIVPKALDGLFRKTNVSPKAISKFILPTTVNGVAAALAKKSGIPDTAIAGTLSESCGYTGAAHGLLMLVQALETAKAGDLIVVANFANGCDALLFEVTPEIEKARPRRGVTGSLARGKSTEEYTRFLAFNGELNVDWGMRAEFGNKYALTTEYRTGHDNLAFLGGRDVETGVVQFPKTPASVGPGAHGVAKYEDVPLADETAKVVSYTADWLTYYPSPPLYFGLAQFDNGARMLMEFVDVPEGSLKVGAPLEMLFRVKEIDTVRGYRHYFWKATPVIAQAEAAE